MKLLNNIVTPPKEEFDRAIAKVLEGSEYARLKGLVTDFIQRIKEALNQWITNMLQKLDQNNLDLPKVSDKLSTVFIIIGLLVIVGIIIFIILKSSKVFERNIRVKEILGEKIDDRTTPFSLRNKAVEFEQKGDTRRAIRFSFIAILLLLHEKRFLYLDETKTNDEIYQYLKKKDFSQIQVFEALTGIFNASWYGHKAYDGEGYKDWCSKVDLLWNEVINDEIKR